MQLTSRVSELMPRYREHTRAWILSAYPLLSDIISSPPAANIRITIYLRRLGGKSIVAIKLLATVLNAARWNSISRRNVGSEPEWKTQFVSRATIVRYKMEPIFQNENNRARLRISEAVNLCLGEELITNVHDSRAQYSVIECTVQFLSHILYFFSLITFFSLVTTTRAMTTAAKYRLK